MWNTIWTILSSSFVWGFMIGLFLTLVVFYISVSKRRALRKDLAQRDQHIDELKRHLGTHLDITAEGSVTLKTQLESLRRQNENLRVAVKALQEKPDRRDRRTLHVYQRAIELMHEHSPAFAPVWESCCRRGEEELQEAESGTVSRVWHKLFPRRAEPLPSRSLPLSEPEDAEATKVSEPGEL